jgi:hypothetical protein
MTGTVVAHDSVMHVDELFLPHGNRMTRVAILRKGTLSWWPPAQGSSRV